MISLKSNFIIASLFFILQILNIFGDSDFSLYGVTSNPVGSYVTIIIPFNNQVIANTSLNLNGLNIQSFLTVDSGLNVITLLCQDSKNSNYLVIADVNTGEIKKSKGIQNDGFNIKNNNNYIYSNVSDDIYLPTFSNGELTILHWNFNQQSDYANQLTINGISDIDSTYQPKGVITSNNGLYIFYKSIDRNNSTSKLVLLNLNSTDSGSFSSSSSSLQPVLPTIEIYTYNGFEADNVEMIYVDNEDNNLVYAVYNSNGTTRSCTLLFSEQNPICQDAFFEYNLNPNNYYYNPYFITSDLSSFVSLQSTSPSQLLFGVWSLDFGADTTIQIFNLWQSTNPSNVTYFKN
ncbi:hypothetical protein ACTFIY_011212 [Dictyostelium cf. discoideum]